MLISLTLIFLNGCSSSRVKPISNPNPQLLKIPESVTTKKYLISLIYDEATVDGRNFDGLLQIPQPWSLSSSEKESIYGNAGKPASISLFNELKRQGLQVSESNKSYLLLKCEVKRIVINTYAMFAGNYWEAHVDFHAQLSNSKNKKVIWSNNYNHYAKLEPSPTFVDWADFMLTLGKLSLSNSTNIPSTDTFDVYQVNSYKISPVEVAARYAAIDIINNIISPY